MGQARGPGVSVSRKRLSRFLGWDEVRAAERHPDSSKVAACAGGGVLSHLTLELVEVW